MNKRRKNKKLPVTLTDRVGIGLLSAFTFIFFYGIVYGLVVLSSMRASATLEDGSAIAFMLSLFAWGSSVSFVVGFLFVVNPVESVLNYFEKKK